MKTLLKKLCLAAVCLLAANTATAYDFEYDNIVYNIVSETEKTCEVEGYSAFDIYDIEFPEMVTYNGNQYHVIGIAARAFQNYGDLRNIIIPKTMKYIGDFAFYGCYKLEKAVISGTIGDGAFYYCMSLHDVTLTETVTEIGDSAFCECTYLYEISIPQSVKSIGNYAFAYCNLKNIIIPESVTTIGNSTFESCRDLTNITLPNTITSIGDRAFCNCRTLESINIPTSVKNIGESAFSWCDNLVSATISGDIGEKAFYLCASLTSIVLAETVTSIGEDAFYECSSLKDIEFSNSLIEIGERAFMSCSSLTTIQLPQNVSSISDNVFLMCSGLTEISIPESVNSIGYSAFRKCVSLKNIDIPVSVKVIESSAFSGCTSLTTANISGDIKSMAFTNCTNLTKVTLTDFVTSIGSFAFSECSSLVDIDIPKSVTHVGISAFENCISLENATISGQLDMAAFSGCSSLTKIVFTETASIKQYFQLQFQGCTNIKDIIIEDGDNALRLHGEIFKDAPVENLYVGRNMSANYYLTKNIFGDNENLKEVVFGSKVTSLGDFGIKTCENITNITSLNPTPPTIDDNFFTDEQYSTIKLDVPEGSISLYKQSKGWRHFYNEGTTSMSKIESAAKMTVTAGDGCIMVSNANGAIQVYTSAGTLLKSAKASGDAEITVPGHGVYIVKTGGKTVKVAL